MKIKIVIALMLAGLLMSSSSAFAEEETVEDPSCQVECPDGQSKVSFADGARVACVCSPQSTGMDETIESVSPCTDANDDGACD